MFSTASEKQITGTWANNSRLVIQLLIFSSPFLTSNIPKTMLISNVLFTQCHLAHFHVRKGIGLQLESHKI